MANPDAPEEPENILLIGSDKRSGQATENPDIAGQRSDTTILLHLAADRQSAVLVSIPRDTIVDIPSCQRRDGTTLPAQPAAMFNSAFSEAGAACTIKTVEQLTKIRIDHHVVVDFGGFKDMVNALGGVQGLRPAGRRTTPTPTSCLAKGTHIVKGQQALAYVRTRHGLGNGSDLVPHRPPAGLPRLDGDQDQEQGPAAPAGPAAELPRRGHQLDHHRPRTRQPQRAAQAGPGRQGHRHQERHVPDRPQRAVRPPTPTACS